MSIPTHLDARFRERAASDGLLDVAYDVTDSPVGPLLVAATQWRAVNTRFGVMSVPLHRPAPP